MALEPGPAAFFDLATIDLTPEPPLSDSDMTLGLDAFDPLTADMDAVLAALSPAVVDLQGQTFNNGVDDSVFRDTLTPPVFSTPDADDAAIADGLAEADGEVAAAALAIPVIQGPPPPPAPTGSTGAGSGRGPAPPVTPQGL